MNKVRHYENGLIYSGKNDLGFRSDFEEEVKRFAKRITERLIVRVDPETIVGKILREKLGESVSDPERPPYDITIGSRFMLTGYAPGLSSEPTLATTLLADMCIDNPLQMLFPIKLHVQLDPFDFLGSASRNLTEFRGQIKDRIAALEDQTDENLDHLRTQIPSKADIDSLSDYETWEDYSSAENELWAKFVSLDEATQKLERQLDASQ